MKSMDPFKPSIIPGRQNNETKTKTADTIKEIFPFSKTSTGLVIRSGGNTIQNLEEDSGTKLHVMEWKGEKAVLIQNYDQNSVCLQLKLN